MQTSAPVPAKIIAIPASVIDEHRHANNVAFLQWMQDIAVEHFSSLGGLEVQRPFGSWFIREHRLEYFGPAFSGEEIEVRTWAENIRRVQSQRKYEFVRKRDGKTLVPGETERFFVDTKGGTPLAIPKEVRAVLHPSPLQQDPE